MGPSANAGCAVRRIERLARSLTALFFGLRPARLRQLLTLTLAAAEGEQDGDNEPATICPLIYGELYLASTCRSIVGVIGSPAIYNSCGHLGLGLPCLRTARKEIAIRRRHWPTDF